MFYVTSYATDSGLYGIKDTDDNSLEWYSRDEIAEIAKTVKIEGVSYINGQLLITTIQARLDILKSKLGEVTDYQFDISDLKGEFYKCTFKCKACGRTYSRTPDSVLVEGLECKMCNAEKPDADKLKLRVGSDEFARLSNVRKLLKNTDFFMINYSGNCNEIMIKCRWCAGVSTLRYYILYKKFPICSRCEEKHSGIERNFGGRKPLELNTVRDSNIIDKQLEAIREERKAKAAAKIRADKYLERERELRRKFEEEKQRQYDKAVEELGDRFSIVTWNGDKRQSLFHCSTCDKDFLLTMNNFRKRNYDCPSCKYLRYQRTYSSRTADETRKISLKAATDELKGKFTIISWNGEYKKAIFRCSKCKQDIRCTINALRKNNYVCEECDGV